MTSAVVDAPGASTGTSRGTEDRIVLRPAPVREPPFDDEVADGALAAGRYDRPLPFRRARRRRVPLPAPAASPARAALPDPALWARRLLLGIIETAGGRRPLNQLSALLSPGVAHGLRTEFELAGQLGRPHWTSRGVIGSVRATEPADQVAELCATVRDERRVHAVAIRLEVRHGRWCCTRLVLG
jgi:hypothetical protein